MNSCIFCKITEKKIPAEIKFETDAVIIIEDLHPQAEKHFLVIPKKHSASLDDMFKNEGEAKNTIAEMFLAANKFAHQVGLLPGGYRSVINTNENGGQTVFHTHLHLLGGEKLKGTFA